jgi:hypothetical protein
MKTRPNYKCFGSTLAVVMVTTAILMVVVGIAVEYTTTVTRNTQRTSAQQSAIAIGDDALEVLFNNWRSTCRSAPDQLFKSSDFSAVATPSPFPNLPTTKFVKRGTSLDPANDEYDSTYTISNYKVVAVSAEYTALPSASATPEPQLGQLGGDISSVSPTTSATYSYVASADVTLPTSFGSGTVVAKVRRVFSRQQMSPWNWAIFYVDPLEIHPGPQFTVTGWVHTNSDLYTAHNTLTFADKVTYGSDWFINFMPGDAQHPGETPQTPNYPNNLPPAREQEMQPFGMDSTSIFSTSDSNPNNDSYAELIQPPVSGKSDPLADARYWNEASVVIQVDASNNVTIGTPKSSGGITVLSSSSSLYKMFSSALTTNQTIQDNREGASVRLITLDVSKILQATSTPTYKSSSFNGIVYIYDNSANSSNRRGVRIINGSKIPSTGLTVVSQNPVYVQGDFNTGGTGTSVPSNGSTAYNNGNTPNPQVSGYTRAPCSILADAVNVLSNSWSDSNSTKSLSSRVASNTTVNAAIVSGIVPTNVYNDGGYSGGAENFPRFLEDWSSATLTYYGSMVELYKSLQSMGEWGKGNVYNPPTREWFFDTNFRLNPPPGSLMVYSYTKGRWYVL